MLKKIYNKEQTRIEKFLTGIIGILFLFYVVSCSSGSSSTTPSSSSSLSSIRALTLEGVDDDSITLSWKLLTTEEGTVDPTIIYTVYAETNNGTAFTKDSKTESTYPITEEDMADGRGQVGVSNLQVNNLYRIVVEARDDLGGSSKSHLLAYTASELAITNISGVVVTTTTDSREVTVTWNSNDQAQGYLVQATDRGNEFGGTVSTDDIIEVICLPGSLLCEGESDQFAEVEEGKLKHVFQVNKQGGRYKVVVVPFNFRDLGGLEVIDEEGKEKSFTEGVLARVKAEGSLLKNRLADALEDPDQVKEVPIQVSKAGAPVDLELESTGNTISASWGHGVGAESYYAIITTNEEVYTFTNTIDRNETNGRFTGGGYTIFTNLVADTSYTVTVQSFTVVSNSTTMGGEVSATISTKDVSDTLGVPQGVSKENLTLTNEAAGILRIVWDTPETNSVIGYNVFYWTGDIPPAKPQYVAGKGETNLRLTVSPDSYNVRVDVLSTYPKQEVVAGDTSSITIYGKPSMPRDLGIAFSRGSFTNIDNKLYAIGYPLSYTGADTLAEAGGPLADVSYDYRYRVEGGEWVGYSKAGDKVVVSLMVDDLADPAVIKSGYGKKYQVELVASNAGGFVSEAATLGFTYKSFPEPFMQSENLDVKPGDGSLTVTWPEVVDKNGATVANYTVVLNTNPYALPVRSTNTVEQKVVFEGLENNQAYLITVIPNGVVTGNILTALSLVTGYEIGTAVVMGSVEETILGTYTGVPRFYIPQGAPEVVINLIATIEGGQAMVSWEKASAGSPATGYVLEYLSDVTTLISNLYTSGDAADAELRELDWAGAVSTNVVTNDSGSYSEVIDGLNISTATNVFRVRAVRLDEQGKEWPGEYRYYAMGSDISRPPNTVGNLAFTNHNTDSFRVTWSEPNSWGKDKDGTDAESVGYRVSWGITAELRNTNEVDGADTLFYEITGLTAGTQYYVKVEAKNDNADENIYSVATTGDTYVLSAPAAPTSFATEDVTSSSIAFTWAAPVDAGKASTGDATLSGYRFEYKLANNTTWTNISSVTTGVGVRLTADLSGSGAATGVTVEGLRGKTDYDFRISAKNSVGLYGEVASITVGTTSGATVPGDNVNVLLTFTGHATNGFTVNWGEATSGVKADGSTSAPVTNYLVEWGTNVNTYASFENAGLTNSYVINNLNTGTQYFVRVRAIADSDDSSKLYSTGNIGNTYTIKPPGAVGTITYRDHTTTGFTVSWNAVTEAGYNPQGQITSPVGYLVEWSRVGGDWQSVTRSDYTTNKETLSGLNSGISYRVRITATNSYSKAAPSVGGDTSTLSLPGEVGSLEVSDPSYDTTSHTGGFKVSWTAPTNTGLTADGKAATITGYEVAYAEMVGEALGKYTTVTVVASTTSYVFTGLNTTNDGEYKIRIRSTTSVGTTAGKVVSGWTPSLPAAVDPNSILLTSATSSTIDIEWTAPQEGRAGGASSDYTNTLYKVEVSSNEINYTLVRDNYSNTELTATGLSKSTEYRAWITAKNVWGEAAAFVSTNTATTLATDATPPSAVQDLKVDSVADIEVMLSWTAPADKGNEALNTLAEITGYIVKYKKSADTNFIQIDENSDGVRLTGALTGTSTNATVTGLSASTTYQFIVVAINSANMFGAEPTPAVGTTMAITPPENLRQVNTCAKLTSVDLAWDASTGATSYKLYRNGTKISDVTNNFYTDTGLSAGTIYTYTVQVCKGSSCSGNSDSLTNTTLSDKSLKAIIDLGSITDLSSYDQGPRDIFSRYAGGSTPTLVAKYLKPDGTGDGTSFANAAGNLKTVLEGITDASASKVYAVLLTGGNYKAGAEMAMKNHVAIIGGLDECLDPSPDQVTELDGNNAYRVFNNDNNGLTNTSLLYGVTITNGRISSGSGGGMYNDNSSPSLVGVTFSGNTADVNGGGMYNYDNSSPSLVGVTFSGNTADDGGGMVNHYTSSPSLEGVTFSGNTANDTGGGMANYDNSSPSLVGVTFSGNTADYGGGMVNHYTSSPSLEGVTFSGNKADVNGGGMVNHLSSPSLEGVTFSGNTAERGGGMYNSISSDPSLEGVTFSENTATYFGGGMFNLSSSPSLEGVTFSENTAASNGGGMVNNNSSPSLVGVTFSGNKAAQGGGMYNDNNNGAGPLIINGIFWGNTASSVGPQFYFHNNGTTLQENLRIYNSIVEGGTGTLVSGDTNTSVNQEGFGSESEESAPIVISFANITTTDPGLGELANNGGSVLTHAIEINSPAVNQGLYVRKSGTTLYYSGDSTTWYNSPDLSGTAVTPPAGAEDLTATDATGYTRTGKPDLGAYEAR